MRQIDKMDKKKKKDKVAALLMLCFCLIALTSVFTIKASIDKVAESAENVPVTRKAATEQEKESQQTEKPPEKGREQTSAAASEIPTVDSRSEESSSSSGFASPMDRNTASVSKEYSMDMVIYNMTLDQYMTHPGIDIEAPAGSGVMAIGDGTITDIYTDDCYGTTIEITHSNGYISRYCNLSTKKLVEKGDTVKKGQLISSIGRTALYESMEKAHLHFEIRKDGKPCDPSEFIDF